MSLIQETKCFKIWSRPRTRPSKHENLHLSSSRPPLYKVLSSAAWISESSACSTNRLELVTHPIFGSCPNADSRAQNTHEAVPNCRPGGWMVAFISSAWSLERVWATGRVSRLFYKAPAIWLSSILVLTYIYIRLKCLFWKAHAIYDHTH